MILILTMMFFLRQILTTINFLILTMMFFLRHGTVFILTMIKFFDFDNDIFSPPWHRFLPKIICCPRYFPLQKCKFNQDPEYQILNGIRFLPIIAHSGCVHSNVITLKYSDAQIVPPSCSSHFSWS